MKLRTCNAPLTIAAVIMLLLLQTGLAFAYTIEWYDVRYQLYESGTQKNKLTLQLKDAAGDYVTDKTAVTDVILKDASGNTVQLDTLDFVPAYDYITAQFDTTAYSWTIDSPIVEADFVYDILDPLVIGQYTVEVTMDDGSVLTQTLDYATKMDLTCIPSDSFQISTDSDGNVFWTWDTPKELFTTAQTVDISIRSGVMAYLNGERISLYWPTIPIGMSHCFIPAAIYQDMVSKADKLYFSLQVRTEDSQSRAYSSTLSVTDLTTPVSAVPTSAVTIQSDLSFNLPDAVLETAAGDINLEADFKYFGEQGGKLLWELDSYTTK